MHGKALALLVCLAVAAGVAGCGGGGGGSGSESTPKPEETPLAKRVEEATKRAVERRTQGEAGAGGSGGGASGGEGGAGGSESSSGGSSTGSQGGGNGSGSSGGHGSPGTGGHGGGGGSASLPKHHDSGGGASQFETRGDNSIQESGSEASGSEMREAATALHAFYDARAAQDWNTACMYIATGMVAAMEQAAEQAAKAGNGGPQPEGCPETLKVFSSMATHESLVEAAESIDVGAFRVEGDHGFLLYHGVRGHTYAIAMELEGGAWKVAALAGTPLS